jgi:protein TonB
LAKYFLSLIFILTTSFGFIGDATGQNSSIPFAEVEQPPLYKGCRSEWNPEKQRNCTSSAINHYVNTNFDIDLALDLKLKKVEMKANFIISNEGNVKEIRVTGGPEILNQHLYQILKSLKKFTPGKQGGSPVDVSYYIPVSIGFAF